jgi:hypothetical protein
MADKNSALTIKFPDDTVQAKSVPEIPLHDPCFKNQQLSMIILANMLDW